MAKRSFPDHLFAFLFPDIAINSDGNFVEATGLFDAGDSSNPVLTDEFAEAAKTYFFGGAAAGSDPYLSFDGDRYVPSSSDVVGDSYTEDTANQIYQDLLNATDRQNQAAQSSADRAMEFNEDQAALSREWQSLQNRIVRNFNSREAKESRAWQEYQNQRAMDFSERMANTSYQRAVEDLKRAGLNPKLAANIGGASSPSGVTSSGATASGSAANMQMASLSPLASVLSSYITGADALDRNQNDFVQKMLSTLITVIAFS